MNRHRAGLVDRYFAGRLADDVDVPSGDGRLMAMSSAVGVRIPHQGHDMGFLLQRRWTSTASWLQWGCDREESRGVMWDMKERRRSKISGRGAGHTAMSSDVTSVRTRQHLPQWSRQNHILSTAEAPPTRSLTAKTLAATMPTKKTAITDNHNERGNGGNPRACTKGPRLACCRSGPSS